MVSIQSSSRSTAGSSQLFNGYGVKGVKLNRVRIGLVGNTAYLYMSVMTKLPPLFTLQIELRKFVVLLVITCGTLVAAYGEVHFHSCRVTCRNCSTAQKFGNETLMYVALTALSLIIIARAEGDTALLYLPQLFCVCIELGLQDNQEPKWTLNIAGIFESVYLQRFTLVGNTNSKYNQDRSQQ